MENGIFICLLLIGLSNGLNINLITCLVSPYILLQANLMKIFHEILCVEFCVVIWPCHAKEHGTGVAFAVIV